MIDLAYVLREAWGTGWRHKRLWLLGFVASLGVVGLRTGVASRTEWERAAQELPPNLGQAVLRFLSSPYFTVVALLAVLLILAGAFGLAVLNAIGRAALVDQVRAAEERGSVAVRAGWQEGKRQLWPVLALRSILGLPELIAGPILAGLAAYWMFAAPAGSGWVGGDPITQVAAVMGLLVCLLPLAGLLWVVSIPLKVLLRLAVRARVLEGLGVRESMRRAWATARAHWAATILLWLVQVVGTAIVILVLGLPLLVGAAALSSGAVAVGLVSLLWSIGLTVVVSLVGWLAAAALGGLIEILVSAMWTLAYREMHGLGLTGVIE